MEQSSLSIAFDTFYSWFTSFNLSGFLVGYYGDTYFADFDIVAMVGLITIGIAAFIFLLYYYIVNPVWWSKKWQWGVVCLIVFIICSIYSYVALDNHWYYVYDKQANLLTENLWQYDTPPTGEFIGFALFNGFLCVGYFSILSIFLKNWSSNLRYCPFSFFSWNKK